MRYHLFRNLLVLLSGLLLSQCSRPGKISAEYPFQDSIIREIHLMKDIRNAGAIVPHLQSREELRRYHAALALASVGDSLTVPYLELALKDRSYRVREMAAFALSQTGAASAEKVLLKAVQDQTRAGDRVFLLEQLGACARDTGAAFLLRLNPKDAASRVGLAKGFYRLVRRQGGQEAFQTRLLQLLPEARDEEEIRFLSLAMQRSQNPVPDSVENSLIAFYNAYLSPETRKAIIGVLASIQTPMDSAFYRKNFISNRDELLLLAWLGWSEKHPGFPGFPEKMHALYNENISWNVRYSLQKAIRVKGNSIPGQYPSKAFPWSLLFPYQEAAFTNKTEEILRYLKDSTANVYEKSLFISELPEASALSDALVECYQNTKNALVLRNAALQKLLQLQSPEQIKWLKETLQSGEASFVSLACIQLLEEEINPEWKSWLLPEIQELKKNYHHPSAWETYLDICRLEDKLNGQNSVTEPLTPQPKFGHRELESSDTVYVVEMQTGKGLVVFSLHTAVAPFTVLNIVHAIRTGYYDGKFMHRLVPGFVVQGGCQRGDGWGSPDWLQRSELSPLPFGAGAIGIASVGKDTEGLQLFWMHGHAPHLEGRYSRIGEIEAGMDVLMQLQPGDKIIGMKLVIPQPRENQFIFANQIAAND